jgi:hypothetical protein
MQPIVDKIISRTMKATADTFAKVARDLADKIDRGELGDAGGAQTLRAFAIAAESYNQDEKL